MTTEELFDIAQGRESRASAADKLGIDLNLISTLSYPTQYFLLADMAYEILVERGEINKNEMFHQRHPPREGDFGKMNNCAYIFKNGQWKFAYNLSK